jgi:aspartyl-tRNA(Asn)/glutamyl-tRNA(Gln) amidotransferase subunit C
LSLSKSEKENLKKDLKEIIKMFEILKNAPFDSSIKNNSDYKGIYRDDHVYSHLSVENALKNAPETNEQYFKVPKIIDL